MFNLLSTPWLPAIRRSGRRCTIRPSDIVDCHDDDPVVALDWTRPDFNVAGMEFLAGLLATFHPPEDPHAWLDLWREAPTPDQLDAAFLPHAEAFVLDGAGPRFMQDREGLVSEPEPVELLLIEAPGASTRSKNTDLFVHRDRVARLGRAAAAMALYTFQSWAPSGGAGNRTGLRGGGPLVTMVLPGPPQHRPTLWQTIWANVPCGDPAEPADLPRILPWLAPTITSKDGRVVTPENAHELQAWWGTPRRIRLDFAAPGVPQPCGLTGVPDAVAVTSWRQRPHGANYVAWGGAHPLTPTYQLKPGTERLPLHPQPGGVGYRHWLGLVLQDATGLRQPARAITTWYDERAQDAGLRPNAARLLAAGFDMDNMKARGFVESIMPLPGSLDLDTQRRLERLAHRLVLSAEQVASLLRSAVRTALFSAGATVRPDLELLSAVRERLWTATEPAFFDALSCTPLPPDGEAEHAWHRLLRDTALALFDEAAPLEPNVPPAIHQGEIIPRQVRARRNLTFALRGYGKEGAALFTTLDLPAVAPAKPKAVAKPGKKRTVA